MSAIVYGRVVKRSASDAAGFSTLSDEAKKENKLVSSVAALVPAEVIALHALVVSKTTSTSDEGVTTITDADTLKQSLLVLAVLAAVAYLIGRGLKEWKAGPDLIRMLIPPFAFVAWTGLISTSALTPWFDKSPGATPLLIAGVIAVLLVAISAKVNPPAAA